MKRIVALILALFLCVSMCSCTRVLNALMEWEVETPDDEFDSVTEGILYIESVDMETDEHDYMLLGTNDRDKSVEYFESDPITVLTADDDGLKFEDVDGEYVNTIKYIKLYDENSEEVEITPEIKEIFNHVSKIKHDIMDFRILVCQGYYFPVVELNVNWWSPYELFYYDAKSGELIEIWEYDNEDVVGLKIVDPEKFDEFTPLPIT